MLRQLKKSVDIEKMPSVRVRPTLKVELKQRVLNCKIPSTMRVSSKKQEEESKIVEQLNETVLNAMRKSKRANLGGEKKQQNLLEQCKTEISDCKNLNEIRRSLQISPNPGVSP